MHAFYINHDFKIQQAEFKKGQLFISTPKINKELSQMLLDYSQLNGNKKALKAVKFTRTGNIFKRATAEADFKNMLLVRFGGIGDLIALTSIIDYFEDKNIFFVTQEKYFPLFEWFENKPKLLSMAKPMFSNFSFNPIFRANWAEFNGNGVVERGARRNWVEVFFERSGVGSPDKDFLRPQLKTERINNKPSNIQERGTGKPSILICNKATAPMRSIKASTIIDCIPDRDKYDVFVHQVNLAKDEKVDAVVIDQCPLSKFFLDVYDADMVISVDTGALHFREGIEKPAIGLYNSFTTDSRTKYYQFTKSFDIKSDCDLQPCFIHEKPEQNFCPKSEAGLFDAPCFNVKKNVTLRNQLKEIFKKEL